MLKKEIAYIDYNGVERTETFHFNLSKAELMDMEMSVTGGFGEMVNRIISTKDVPALMDIFKDLIRRAYGVKSADGRRFMKSKELTDEFVQTEAYSDLFMELALNSDEAAKFVNGILPPDFDKKIAEVTGAKSTD